ncbi:MAG: hypothetical protein ACRDG4_02465, partial [Chloroflexota bacterium]
ERKSAAWFDALLEAPAHPRLPTPRQAIDAALDPVEAAAYLAHYRRAVTEAPVTSRQSTAYLWGTVDG